MHDCHKTKKNLVDLVFGELEAGQQQRALAEVARCPDCSQEYQSLLATLRVFDQAADAAMPDESYWMGYEARLRAKLDEPVSPNRREHFAGWFAWLTAKPLTQMAVVAGLILVAAISAVLFLRQKPRNQTALPEVLVAQTTPTPQPTPTASMPVQPDPAQNEIRTQQPSFVAVKSQKTRQPRPIIKLEAATPDNLIATAIPRSPQAAAPASHFEKAQLLLRSFRNARSDGKNTSLDLAYEKQQAGKLVYDNILLRREAEAKGYLPVEEALNSLEPLLLDIANLPDKPSRGEVQMIRERIQKQELIATLQIASSGAERFSPPALLNP